MKRKLKKEKSKRIKHQQNIQCFENQWLENQSSSIPFGCRGCRHLHGRTYEGILTVCGMHPFGLENCPDFEAKPTSLKKTASGGKSVLMGEIIVEFLARSNF